MKERVLAATVVGGILAGAGFLATTVSAPAPAVAQENPSESSEAKDVAKFPVRSALLEEVLSELVEDGTIDQEQADAILQSIAEKAAAFRSEAEGLGSMIREFLEDGAISADELEQLPDIPLFDDLETLLGDALDDGVITREELAELFPRMTRNGAYRAGVRHGSFFDDGGIDRDEFASLPADHPLRSVDTTDAFADDGVISLDEFRDLMKSQADLGDSA